MTKRKLEYPPHRKPTPRTEERREYEARRREEMRTHVEVDLAEIRQYPPDPNDIARDNRLPWERHPIPWDNVVVRKREPVPMRWQDLTETVAIRFEPDNSLRVLMPMVDGQPDLAAARAALRDAGIAVHARGDGEPYDEGYYEYFGAGEWRWL